MSKLRLDFGRHGTRETSERNWEGENVPAVKSTEYWLYMVFAIAGEEPEKPFSLTTTAIAKISKVGLPADRREQELTAIKLGAAQLARDLATRHIWRTFGNEDVRLDPATPADWVKASELADEQQVAVECASELYERLSKDAERIDHAGRVYDQATKQLYDLSASSPSEIARSMGQIRPLLNFVEACNEASADSYMYSWYREKTHRIKRAFEEMSRRKITSNHNYQLAVSNASNLLHFHAPSAYIEEPPSPHQVEECLGKNW